MAQHGEGEGGVLHLMRAGKAGERGFDAALFVAIVEAVAVAGCIPAFAHGEPVGAGAGRCFAHCGSQ